MAVVSSAKLLRIVAVGKVDRSKIVSSPNTCNGYISTQDEPATEFEAALPVLLSHERLRLAAECDGHQAFAPAGRVAGSHLLIPVFAIRDDNSGRSLQNVAMAAAHVFHKERSNALSNGGRSAIGEGWAPKLAAGLDWTARSLGDLRGSGYLV